MTKDSRSSPPTIKNGRVMFLYIYIYIYTDGSTRFLNGLVLDGISIHGVYFEGIFLFLRRKTSISNTRVIFSIEGFFLCCCNEFAVINRGYC